MYLQRSRRCARAIAGIFAVIVCCGQAFAASQILTSSKIFEQAVIGAGNCTGGDCGTHFYQPEVLAQFLLQLIFMLVLSLAIAFHPMRSRKKKTLASLAVPRIFLLYSLIGMAIGFLVVQYGYLIGFVVFGIGGLLRFRSTFENRADTAEVVLVTVLGLCTGLNLLFIALIIGLSAWCIIWATGAFMGCALNIRCETDEQLEAQIDHVSAKMAELGWQVKGIERSFERAGAEILFRVNRAHDVEDIRTAISETLDPDLASWKLKT